MSICWFLLHLIFLLRAKIWFPLRRKEEASHFLSHRFCSHSAFTAIAEMCMGTGFIKACENNWKNQTTKPEQC